MCLLAVKFPICKRKIIVNMWKIATITFLDTGCLVLIVYCFLGGLGKAFMIYEPVLGDY